jgi:flagellar motor switch protein FliN/FliY
MTTQLLSATASQLSAAADALAELLPTTTPVTAAQTSDRTMPTLNAVVASFVGSVSADVALVLTDASSVAGAGGSEAPLISLTDVLRPALEAATSGLGAGVLDEAVTADASLIFSDPAAGVFTLNSAGATVGWFAIRIRTNTGSFAAGAAPALSDMSGKLGRINDVDMALTVEVGRTRMSVRDVLNLKPGDVVELDRSAGAPADVLLNGRLIAQGEIVVVDQDYAVRITRILDVAAGQS